jgi:hypothetical protein
MSKNGTRPLSGEQQDAIAIMRDLGGVVASAHVAFALGIARTNRTIARVLAPLEEQGLISRIRQGAPAGSTEALWVLEKAGHRVAQGYWRGDVIEAHSAYADPRIVPQGEPFVRGTIPNSRRERHDMQAIDLALTLRSLIESAMKLIHVECDLGVRGEHFVDPLGKGKPRRVSDLDYYDRIDLETSFSVEGYERTRVLRPARPDAAVLAWCPDLPHEAPRGVEVLLEFVRTTGPAASADKFEIWDLLFARVEHHHEYGKGDVLPAALFAVPDGKVDLYLAVADSVVRAERVRRKYTSDFSVQVERIRPARERMVFCEHQDIGNAVVGHRNRLRKERNQKIEDVATTPRDRAWFLGAAPGDAPREIELSSLVPGLLGRDWPS